MKKVLYQEISLHVLLFMPRNMTTYAYKPIQDLSIIVTVRLVDSDGECAQ